MAEDVSSPPRPSPPSAQGPTEPGADTPFQALRREMNRLFDDVFHGRLAGVFQAGSHQAAPTRPIMDVTASDRQVRVTIELPGIDSDDIDLSLDGDLLTVRAERKVEAIDPKDSCHIIERSYGTLQRTVTLPCAVIGDRSEARFDNGVLIVTLPKAGLPESGRKIAVQGARAPGSAITGPPAEAPAAGRPADAAP